MNYKQLFLYFVGMFILALVVCVSVIYFYSLIVHKVGAVDWESALSFALFLAIVMTWIIVSNKKKSKGKK